jgi:hypothetical protein
VVIIIYFYFIYFYVGTVAINGGIVNFFYSNPSEALCTACGAYCLYTPPRILYIIYGID